MRQNMKHMCTHTDIQSDTSQGIIIMTGVKPWFPLVSLVSVATCLCVCLWKTDVWSELCVSVAGSHIAALSQFLRPWSDLRSARRGEHSRLPTTPVSQPWAITLLSLSSETIKTEEKVRVRGKQRDQHTSEWRKSWIQGSGLFIWLCSLKCPSCIISLVQI